MVVAAGCLCCEVVCLGNRAHLGDLEDPVVASRPEQVASAALDPASSAGLMKHSIAEDKTNSRPMEYAERACRSLLSESSMLIGRLTRFRCVSCLRERTGCRG